MTETLQKARRGQLLPCAPCAVPGEADRLRAAEGIARAAVRRYRGLMCRWHVRLSGDELRNSARVGVLRAIRAGRTEDGELFREARHAVLAEIRRERHLTRGVARRIVADTSCEDSLYYETLRDGRTPERILIAREELQRVARESYGAGRRALIAAAEGEPLNAAGRVALAQARRLLSCDT